MNKRQAEVIVVHGGGITPEGELSVKAVARMDTGIAAYKDGVAPRIAVTGKHSFTARKPIKLAEADAMEAYAVGKHVPVSDIHKEKRSLETVGNVLFTINDILIPEDWEEVVVDTSKSHLPRTMDIWQHVGGRDFSVSGISAPEQVGIAERIYEPVGSLLVREILRGTKPGDREAIEERLFDLVPGYIEDSPATIPRLAVKSATGLLKG